MSVDQTDFLLNALVLREIISLSQLRNKDNYMEVSRRSGQVIQDKKYFDFQA